MAFDRIKEWNKFNESMNLYLEANVLGKYGSDETGGMDMLDETTPQECIWNIIKYALRMRRKSGKTNDLFKIAHYAQIAFSKCGGDLSKAGITNDKGN